MIQIDIDRFGSHRRDLFDANWNRIPATLEYPNSNYDIAKPKHLQEMLHLARELSSGIDFIRIDLYETNQGVKFGEMTNYPGGGLETFKPISFNSSIGKSWIPKY